MGLELGEKNDTVKRGSAAPLCVDNVREILEEFKKAGPAAGESEEQVDALPEMVAKLHESKRGRTAAPAQHGAER
eukprot:55856-Pyramimonas_sp.AAC.1